jgi:hypothetical protein
VTTESAAQYLVWTLSSIHTCSTFPIVAQNTQTGCSAAECKSNGQKNPLGLVHAESPSSLWRIKTLVSWCS